MIMHLILLLLGNPNDLKGTSKNKRALILGNGINQLDTSQSFSWGKLLNALKSRFSINVDLDNFFKPFPLAFDEMLHWDSGKTEFKDRIRSLKEEIKKSIDSQLEHKRGFNEYHRRIVELDYDDILTTNYDYSLERSIEPDFLEMKIRLALNKQEMKYSLKRCYQLPNHKSTIWHIHGELMDSRRYRRDSKNYHEESIMIGYEHYADYLRKIQENIAGESGIHKTENQSLRIRLRNKEKESPFWTDILFTHNVDIVGQAFDFSENHLWWLINHRANLIREEKSENSIPVNNRIRFYYPEIDRQDQFKFDDLKDMDKVIRKKNSIEKAKAIAELLNAFYVFPMPVPCKSYPDFYEQLIDSHLKKR